LLGGGLLCGPLLRLLRGNPLLLCRSLLRRLLGGALLGGPLLGLLLPGRFGGGALLRQLGGHSLLPRGPLLGNRLLLGGALLRLRLSGGFCGALLRVLGGCGPLLGDCLLLRGPLLRLLLPRRVGGGVLLCQLRGCRLRPRGPLVGERLLLGSALLCLRLSGGFCGGALLRMLGSDCLQACRALLGLLLAGGFECRSALLRPV